MDEGLYEQLRVLSEENGLPLATFIRSLLIQHTKGKLSALDPEVIATLASIAAKRPDVTF